MDRMKLRRTVEYLKSAGFYRDTFDLEDGVQKDLAAFGIHDAFSEEELVELRRDLLSLVEENEFEEAERDKHTKINFIGMVSLPDSFWGSIAINPFQAEKLIVYSDLSRCKTRAIEKGAYDERCTPPTTDSSQSLV